MTYDEYISRFEIYDSYRAAQAKGYEAHHIIPRALQKEEPFDDRCVRLTSFEHVYAHYLLALEREDAIRVFFWMVNGNISKLSDIEKVNVENLKHWATLREQGREKISEAMKGHPGTYHSPEVKKKISEAQKGKSLSSETKQKLSDVLKGHPGWNKGILHSEEVKKKISEAMKGRPVSEEAKKKISEANKGKPGWNKGQPLSSETKEKIAQALKGKPGKPHSAEWNRNISEANKAYFSVPENRKKISESTRIALEDPEVRKKMSDSLKGKPAWNKGIPCSEEEKKKIKEKNTQAQRQLAEEYRSNNPLGLSWNEFQKYYREQSA